MDVYVKFSEDCDPENGSNVFIAGSVHKLNPASARHWTRRGKAVEITAKEAKTPDAAKIKADEKTKAATGKKSKAKADAAKK